MSILPAFLDPYACMEPTACYRCGDYTDGSHPTAERCEFRTVHTIEDERCTRCCDCAECAHLNWA